MKKQTFIVLLGAIIMGFIAGYLVVWLTNKPTELEQPDPIEAAPLSENFSVLDVDLITTDGVNLKANYYPSKGTEAETSTILLLHGAYEDSRSWANFKKSAQEKGFAVFTVDLRGHGKSSGEKVFDEAMDYDVDAALTWLQNFQKANTEEISIIGASLGANLALRAGTRYPELKSIILLSPGMSLWEIGIAEAIINYGSRPIMLIAAEEDSYPAGTVQQLGEKALGFPEVHIYPGAAHGTELLDVHPDLTLLMLNWLEGNFY